MPFRKQMAIDTMNRIPAAQNPNRAPKRTRCHLWSYFCRHAIQRLIGTAAQDAQ